MTVDFQAKVTIIIDRGFMADTEPLSRPKKSKGKILIIFLCLLFITFGLSRETASQFSCDSFPCFKGDLNEDGILTPADVVLHLLCVFPRTGNCDSCKIDLNCDGTPSVSDVIVELNAVFLGIPVANFNYPGVIAADDSNVPLLRRTLYLDDAARIALHVVDSLGGCVREKVEFQNGLVQIIYNALIHIYNDSELVARDSVVDYWIHTHPTPRFSPLIVDVAFGTTWVEAWKQDSLLTGNPQVDQLLECHDLQLGSLVRWPWFYEAELTVPRQLNIRALARRFMEIDSVVWAGAHGAWGDGNDIQARFTYSYWELDYSLGWGDCPAGCTERHWWRFRVYSDGSVQFITSWGDPLS